MVVIVLEKVPISLRGELTRWLLEVHVGVFVGSISAMVRELLWKLVVEKLHEGGGIMIHNAANEQGYNLRMCGNTSRQIVDYDGLALIRCPNPKKQTSPSDSSDDKQEGSEKKVPKRQRNSKA